MTHRTQKEFQNLEEDPDELDRFFVNGQIIHPNRTEWDCTIIIDNTSITAYQHGAIVVTMVFPSEYPLKPPTIFFKTPVFHPYVKEETGELCSCIMTKIWLDADSHSIKNARYVLSQLYNMIESDGSNYDKHHICRNRGIQETREKNYMLFFSVIQNCLGLELPEDDSEDMTYANRGTWEECVQKQQHLHVIQDELVTSLFQGRFEGMNSIVRRFLGRATKEELLSEYTLTLVEQPTGTCTTRIITLDGYRDVRHWSSIKLLDNFDDMNDTTIHIPFTTEKLSSVIDLCKTEDTVTLRCVSPSNEYADDVVSQLIAPFQAYSKKETFEILKTADFLGVERIVISACLYLSHLIRRESRTIHTVASTEASNASPSRATFQTFVSLNFEKTGPHSDIAFL